MISDLISVGTGPKLPKNPAEISVGCRLVHELIAIARTDVRRITHRPKISTAQVKIGQVGVRKTPRSEAAPLSN